MSLKFANTATLWKVQNRTTSFLTRIATFFHTSSILTNMFFHKNILAFGVDFLSQYLKSAKFFIYVSFLSRYFSQTKFDL